MSPRLLILVGILITVVMISVPVAGQQGPTTSWSPSRTAWGDPDLQGVYTFSTQTPVERPKELAGKAFYTEAELKELAARAEAARRSREERDVDPKTPPGGYDAVWTASEGGRLSNRTSLIIDPEDGRLPALTPLGQKIRAEIEAEEASRTIGNETITIVGQIIPSIHAASPAPFQELARHITTVFRSCKCRVTWRFTMRVCTTCASSPWMAGRMRTPI